MVNLNTRDVIPRPNINQNKTKNAINVTKLLLESPQGHRIRRIISAGRRAVIEPNIR